MANDIVADVKQVREKDKSANIDISGIVNRYVVKGSSRTSIEEYLKVHGFKLNPQPAGPDGSEVLIAVHAKQSGLFRLGFHDEIRVIVVFENGVVKKSSGMLIYRAL